MKWSLWLVLAALAGCAADPPTAAPTQEGPAPLDIDTGPDVGAISGVVVSQSIVPIPNANISVIGAQRGTTTDALGQFVFNDLAPGVYFLNITAAGFLPVQTSTEVRGGEVGKMRVLLTADMAPVPWHETLFFQGYIQAYMGTASFAVQILTNTSQLCRCQFEFQPGPGIDTFVFEAHWTPNVANPAMPNNLYWELTSNDPQHIESAYDESPILHHIARDVYPAESVQWMARLTGDFFWPSYDQDYEMFVTKFYLGPAPEGWSLVAGDV